MPGRRPIDNKLLLIVGSSHPVDSDVTAEAGHIRCLSSSIIKAEFQVEG